MGLIDEHDRALSFCSSEECVTEFPKSTRLSPLVTQTVTLVPHATFALAKDLHELASFRLTATIFATCAIGLGLLRRAACSFAWETNTP